MEQDSFGVVDDQMNENLAGEEVLRPGEEYTHERSEGGEGEGNRGDYDKNTLLEKVRWYIGIRLY